MKEAEASLRLALRTAEARAEREPNDFWATGRVSQSCDALAKVLIGDGQLKEAEVLSLRTIGIAEKLNQSIPDESQRMRSVGPHAILGTLLWTQSKHDEAYQHFSVAKSTHERNAGPKPEPSDEWVAYIRLIADCPCKTLREPSRAVELARQLADRVPVLSKSGALLAVRTTAPEIGERRLVL